MDLILDECIKRVKYGSTYRSSIYLPKSTFNKIYLDLHKRNILKKSYIELLKMYFKKSPNRKLMYRFTIRTLLKMYFKKSPNRKLMYRFTDTTCFVNKNGKTKVKYNGYKKRKVTKGSLETDSNGVVIKSTLNNGNMNDARIFIKDISKEYLVDKDLLERFKNYYVADSGYDTEEIKNYLNEEGFTVIIKGNKKNTKDVNKLKKFKMSKYQKYIYNKRFIIEDTNSNIKSFKLIQTRMDSKSCSFENSLFISYINKVLKYI